MNALDLALRNLAAWSLQVAVLGLAAAALSRLFPIERPAARLAFGQALLAVVLGLPLAQPWHATAPAVSWSLASTPSPASVAPLAAPGGSTPFPAIPGSPLAVAGLLLLGVSFGLMRVGAGLVGEEEAGPRRRSACGARSSCCPRPSSRCLVSARRPSRCTSSSTPAAPTGRS